MRKFLATIISAFLHCIIIAMLSFGVIIYYFSQDLPDYSELANYDPETMTRLYAADGKLLAEYAIEKRIYVPLTSIPKRVIQAFISAEDKDFYTNTGLDFRGIARAVRKNIEHLKGNNKAVAGGSTITQQVVKNFLLTPEKTLSRKIKEAILAFRITQVYSKDRILELYLNEIYLGKGSYGIAASALNYFNKPLDELTLEEAAFLAALPKTPGRSDLVQQKERRDYVINRMMDDGNITATEAKAAIANPVTMKSRDKTEMANGDFFAEEVRRQLQNVYGDDELYKGGMFVKTTLNTELQKYAEDALRYALIEYDKRKGYRGPVSRLDNYNNWQKKLQDVEARNKLPLFNGEKLALVYESSKTKASIIFADAKKANLDKNTVKWVQSKGLNVGDVIIAAQNEDGKDYTIRQIPQVNGAMVVMEPGSGRVLAMVGGYSYGGTEFNRATQAKRQPGSSFKPFVYLAAMENGFNPASIVVDEPVEISQGNGMPVWRPGNYHGDYLGPTTLRVGLEKSRNAMTIHLAEMLGIEKVIDIAKRFGIYENPPEQFSIILGAQETTLLKLVNAYCMLANGGNQVTPSLIEKIDDRNGKTILRLDKHNCPTCRINGEDKNTANINPPTMINEAKPIADPRAIYQTVYMMQGVVEHGTAAAARKLNKILAGKTGTTNESRDTWFIGFSPDLVVGTFIGYDQPQTMGKKETGGSVALPAFIKFMEKALKDKPSKAFDVPEGIEFAKIDKKTGLPPTPGDDGKIILEAFKQGEQASPDNPTPIPDLSKEAIENIINDKKDFATQLKNFDIEEHRHYKPLQEKNSQEGKGTGGLY